MPQQEMTIPAGEEIFIKKPKQIPHNSLVTALQRFLPRHSEVKRAFLAEIFSPKSGDPPHLLLCLDIVGPSHSLESALGPLIGDAVSV